MRNLIAATLMVAIATGSFALVDQTGGGIAARAETSDGSARGKDAGGSNKGSKSDNGADDSKKGSKPDDDAGGSNRGAGSIARPAPAGKRSPVAPSGSRQSDIGLRQSLTPDGRSHSFGLQAPLRSMPGTPNAVIRVCAQAIENAARAYGAVRVHAESAGPLRRDGKGTASPPQLACASTMQAQPAWRSGGRRSNVASTPQVELSQ